MNHALEKACTPRGRTRTPGLLRVIAGVSALTVVLSGLSATSAQAIPVGAYQHETVLVDDPINAADIEVTQHGDVLAIYGDSVRTFDSDGRPLSVWGSSGNGEGQFTSARGIAIAPNGDVYVTDLLSDRVQKFDRKGNYLALLGGPGTGDGQFDGPAGIAVNASGDVYVADLGNHRIQKFSSTGAFVKKWGTYGDVFNYEFKVPQGVGLDPAGNVYVADTGNHRVMKYDADGNFLTKWGQKGDGPGEFSFPTSVDTDPEGNVFVTSQTSGRVQKFTPAGQFLTEWGNADQYPHLGAIAVGSDGRILTADNFTISASRQATTAAFTRGPSSTAVIGRKYSSELRASGFPAVSAFAVVGGQLPAGLKRVGNAVVGVPNKLGTYEFTLKADNSVTPTAFKKYSITVGKATSRVTASFSTKRPKVRKTKIWVTIKLTAPSTTGLSRTGAIRVYAGSKRVKSATIYKSHAGVIKVRLPKFTKTGKTKITVRYFGNGHLKADKYVTYVRVR